jgi:hypothetical protein
MNPMKNKTTALDRLDRYVWLDDKARWTNDLICMLVAWVWYVVRTLNSSSSQKRIITEVACILIVGVASTTIRYCFKRQKPKIARLYSSPVRSRLGIQAALAVFALSIIFAKPLMTVFETRSPRATFQTLASLDPNQLEASLPILRLVSEQPVSKVAPSSVELQSIAYKLSEVNPNSQNYWPTVLAFIQFASAHFGDKAPPPGTPVTVHLGHNSIIGNAIGLGPSVIEIDGDDIEDATFTDSRIIFTGKPAILKNVRFINCAFEFRNITRPSPYSKAAASQLLAAGIQSVSIASLG